MMENRVFNDQFSAVATRYAAARPKYPTQLYEFVAKSAPSIDRVWDCATGNGQAAVGLSGFFKEVFATDASQEQISNAISGTNISYSVQLAETTNFPDLYFDAVTVAQAIHWFQLDRFIAELTRVLKPDGIVVVWTYGFFRISSEIDQLIREEILQRIAPYWPKENESAWKGYTDIHLPFEKVDAPRIELICHWNLRELMSYLATWSAINRHSERHGAGLIERATEILARVWVDPEESMSVEMDLYVRAWRNCSAT